MRTLTFGVNVGGEVYRASVRLPNDYFDDFGRPKWHLLNSRFSSPVILWDRPIGGVPRDEVVVANVPQPIPIGEELQKLREVVVSLEKKFDGMKL
jgi:hypothetical protein